MNRLSEPKQGSEEGKLSANLRSKNITPATNRCAWTHEVKLPLLLLWSHLNSVSVQLCAIWHLDSAAAAGAGVTAHFYPVIVQIRACSKWPGEMCSLSSGGESRPWRVAIQAELSREAWRRAIITELGRNANQPAMRWVWVGWDAHAYHTGLWKTTPPEDLSACFYCVYCSRQGLLLFKQL